MRQFRLYQASFLLRDYGWSVEDLPFDASANLPLNIDPKLAWAQEHLLDAPLEVNRARGELLQVPGIGPVTADAIVKERRRTASPTSHTCASSACAGSSAGCPSCSTVIACPYRCASSSSRMQQPGLLFRTPCRDELLRQTGLDPGCAVYLHRRRLPARLAAPAPSRESPARDQHDGQLQRRTSRSALSICGKANGPYTPPRTIPPGNGVSACAFPLRDRISVLRGGCAITSASAPSSTQPTSPRQRNASGNFTHTGSSHSSASRAVRLATSSAPASGWTSKPTPVA